jgi:hypothetical protein
MKHIKLFEEVASELISDDIQSSEVKKMSKDEFFNLMDKFKMNGEVEKMVTLTQMFLYYNPNFLKGAEGDFDVNVVNRMKKYLESMPDRSQEWMDMEKIIRLEGDLTRQKQMPISSDSLIKSLELDKRGLEAKLQSIERQIKSLESDKRGLEAKLQSIERQINTIKAGR